MSKQNCTDEGMRVFERIEKGFDKLVKVWSEANAEGMIDVCQMHSLQNETLALKFQTLALHCRGTKVACDNDCDVPDDGGGGPVILGGGGGR